MTNLSSIVAALVASLQLASVPYAFTGADSVKTGMFTSEIPALPFVAVETPVVKSRPWDKRQRKWLHEATITIRAWVPLTAETLANRASTSTSVADELTAALLTGRTNQPALRLVNSFVVTTTGLDPALSSAAPDLVQVALLLQLSYVTAGGV